MIHIAKYLSSDDSDNGGTEAELESFLDLAQPGWRGVLAQHRYLPNMTVVPALATAAMGGLSGRPAVDATGVPGVFLAGDWVGDEAWLSDASFASGRAAAERALAAARPAATPSYA
jgi:hypothetical protein